MSTLVYHADDDLVWKTSVFDFLNVFFSFLNNSFLNLSELYKHLQDIHKTLAVGNNFQRVF